MNRLNSILVLFLFLPYVFGFAMGESVIESGLVSADKLIRAGIMYIALIALFVQLRRSPLIKDVWIYFWPSVLILLILFSHYVLYSGWDYGTMYARKEVFRLAALIVVFMVCATSSAKPMDYRLLIVGLVIMCLIVASFSVWHSLTGEVEQSWRYVGDFLRSGTGITDANSLGAFMNLASLAALAGVFIASRSTYKTLFFLSAALIQAGRFFTFSTGSFYSIILSVILAIFLIGKYNRRHLKWFILVLLGMVVVLAIFIGVSGLYNTLFYRIRFSDEYVWSMSVYSRIDQHADYFSLIAREPSRILYGYGSAGLPQTLSSGLDLHNSFLRPLATGGILEFICFSLLWFMSLVNYVRAIKYGGDEVRVVSVFMFTAFIGWSFQAATLPADTSIIQWFFFILGYMLGHSIEYHKTPASLQYVHAYNL